MKLLTLAAAAAAMLAGVAAGAPAAAAPAPAPVMAAPAPAAAPPQRYEERVVRRTVVRRDRHRARWGNRRVCRTEWRRGHRERVCRTVRYRR